MSPGRDGRIRFIPGRLNKMPDIDLLLIKPGAQKKLYQGLSASFSGLEPPLWLALIAGFIREKGFKVGVVDAEIEPEKLMPALLNSKPRLAAIVVSGTNPSSSTMNMVGVRPILEEIQKLNPKPATILVGLHPSSLPRKSLEEEAVDMVCEGEGFHTLLDLLSGKKLEEIKGLWYRDGEEMLSNLRAELVDPNILPMPAWEILPMAKYRAHNWHCFGRLDKRSPYAVIYTSLGCPFSCAFCCINAIFGVHKIRYREPEKVIEEIDYLVKNYAVENIKILDEMFALKEERVIKLLDLIIERNYRLNMWVYARVDTLNETMLKKMKKAGVNWLGIGFEAGSKRIRDRVSKGRFDNQKIREVVDMVHGEGLYIGGNFIFGLPDDTITTMQETLGLAEELNCEYVNFYTAMAFPGSKLYEEATANNLKLPDSWLGYSQPLPNRYLSPEEILRFRDNAFEEYCNSSRYQGMILEKFGEATLGHIKDMLKYKIKRKLLGD